MPEPVFPSFPILKIKRVLDERNVVISGKGVDSLPEGRKLVVLALGPRMPEVDNHFLVVPKAVLEVIQQAGAYVLASPPVTTKQVDSGITALMLSVGQRTIQTREPLAIIENQKTGNPASRTVSVGDWVIDQTDLPEFVIWLSAQPDNPQLPAGL